MKKFRILLALFALISCGELAFAQFNDGSGGAVGSICEAGRPCPFPGNSNGGGAPIDPSPYDPQPGYPGGHGDHDGYGHGHGHGPHQPPPPPGSGYGNRREVYLGQMIVNQNLDLFRLLGLWNAQGSLIQSVEITLRPGGYAQLQLLANGYMEDNQNVYSPFLTLTPRSTLIVGQNLNSLMVGIRGQVFIDRVAVILGDGYQPGPMPGPQPYPPGPNPGPFPPGPMPGPGPGPGNGGEIVLPGYINQTFYGATVIDIGRAAGLMSYPGYRLASVTVFGQSLGYTTPVRVMANSVLMGTLNLTNSNYGGLSLFPNIQMVVGQTLNSLSLAIDGQARIDRVEVHLRRY